MPPLRRFDLEDILVRPGTYVNATTEIVLIVDDSAAVDAEQLGAEDEDTWLLVADDIPVDESRRDELLERAHRRAGSAPEGTGHDDEDEDVEDDEDLAGAGFADADADADGYEDE